MRTVLSLLMLAASFSAHADQSVPEPRSGQPKWIGLCAARLERARDEAAQQNPWYNDARVELFAGEPSRRAVDVIDLKAVEESSGNVIYEVRVETNSAHLLIPAWTADSPKVVLHHRDPRKDRFPHYRPALRRTNGILVGSLVSHTDEVGRDVRDFESIFRRAVDDCLQMKTTQ